MVLPTYLISKKTRTFKIPQRLVASYLINKSQAVKNIVILLDSLIMGWINIDTEIKVIRVRLAEWVRLEWN